MEGSAMEWTKGDGDGGAVGLCGEVGAGVVVDDKDRLEADTRLSRVSASKTAGPKLRSL